MANKLSLSRRPPQSPPAVVVAPSPPSPSPPAVVVAALLALDVSGVSTTTDDSEPPPPGRQVRAPASPRVPGPHTCRAPGPRTCLSQGARSAHLQGARSAHLPLLGRQIRPHAGRQVRAPAWPPGRQVRALADCNELRDRRVTRSTTTKSADVCPPPGTSNVSCGSDRLLTGIALRLRDLHVQGASSLVVAAWSRSLVAALLGPWSSGGGITIRWVLPVTYL